MEPTACSFPTGQFGGRRPAYSQTPRVRHSYSGRFRTASSRRSQESFRKTGLEPRGRASARDCRQIAMIPILGKYKRMSLRQRFLVAPLLGLILLGLLTGAFT